MKWENITKSSQIVTLNMEVIISVNLLQEPAFVVATVNQFISVSD